MITVRLAGGLGNQLFQLAAAIQLSERVNLPYSFYIGDLKTYTTKRAPMLRFVLGDDFRLNQPNFFVRFILRYRINKIFSFAFPWYVRLSNLKNVPARNTLILDDYFQDCRLLKTGIDTVITKINDEKHENAKVGKIYSMIKGDLPDKSLVAIHVRRGDYLKPENSKRYPTLNKEYYLKAIRQIMPAPERIVVFCENEIFSTGDFQDADVIQVKKFELTDFEEFILFSFFKNLVIANSTYSFWAALAADTNSIRFGPETWAFRKRENEIWNSNLHHYSFHKV
jgi:hypothetical protein